jgi:hypothetical protein
MKYIALITAYGKGCDYMASCGKSFIPVEADDDTSALEKCREMVEHYGLQKIESVELLVPARTISAPVRQWYDSNRERARRERAERELRDIEARAAELRTQLGKPS